MNFAVIVILSLLAVGAATVVALAIFTFVKLKELIRERLDRKHKVAFGNTKKVINQNAKKILDSAPKMKMEDLEELGENENEFFVVNYDEDTEEVTDFTIIQAEEVEDKVYNVLDDTDGIILFE